MTQGHSTRIDSCIQPLSAWEALLTQNVQRGTMIAPGYTHTPSVGEDIARRIIVTELEKEGLF